MSDPQIPAQLEGKVALITGATSGIGAALARRFAAEGADLVLGGRRAQLGEAIASELRAGARRVHFVEADVAEEEGADALARAVKERFGSLDTVVLNAGVSDQGRGEFWSVTPAAFDRLYRTNVRGVWLVARAVVPLLRPGAAVVVMASMASYAVLPGESLYSATKGALIQLTRAMALDLAPRSVRVNALCPGYTDSGQTLALLDAADDPDGLAAEFAAASPLGRMATEREITGAAVFLASNASSYCTGTSLLVDGGVTLT